MDYRIFKIQIADYKIPSWNQFYSGKHWSVRSKMAQEAHMLVGYEVLGKKISIFKVPVDIYITAYQKGRTLDSDNICAKIVIDALKGILIVDDTPQYVRRVTTESIKSSHDMVEIIVSESE